MKNLEEPLQHEMATHATGTHQGGAESWEINYVPYSGGDSPFTIGEVKRSNRRGAVCNQGGGESWKINYVPYTGEVSGSQRAGRDEVKLSNPSNTAGQDEVEKWQSSYVPFSPPSSFPWETIEDENSSKGVASGESGGDSREVHVQYSSN